MSNYRDIILEPIVTEKSTDLAQNQNTYVFSVDTKANKTQIKQAVEKVFNVKVESVNTLNATTKKKRVGRYSGRTNRRKKAMVKLAEGSSIELN